MGYIVYVDIIFIINVCMDYILLNTFGKLTRKKEYIWRQILASILGGMGVLLKIYKIPMPYFIIAFGMVLVAYPEMKKVEALKTMIYFYVLNIIVGGCLFFLKEQNLIKNHVMELLLVSIVLMKIIEKGWNHILKMGRFTKNLYPIELICNKKKISGIALLDTGNRLYDPYFHRPVMIAEHKQMSEIYDVYNKEKIVWIPYHSLGKKNGMIPAIKIEELQIHKENEIIQRKDVLVAIKEEELSSQRQYHFILHEDFFFE